MKPELLLKCESLSVISRHFAFVKKVRYVPACCFLGLDIKETKGKKLDSGTPIPLRTQDRF